MDIGSKGLCAVNLTIPQATSLSFQIIHKDDNDNVIDHSNSTAYMAFQNRDVKTKEKQTYELSECCVCTSQSIDIDIPGSITKNLPLGRLNWDIIVETDAGSSTRLCYGIVNIIDSYAFDKVE